MSILNKTRFLLVSTALVAALQAQGVDLEPTTVSQPTRVAPTQPQTEIREFFQAVPSDVMVKIAQHLPPKDCLNLSCTKKKIQTAVAPVLSRQREIRYIVKQANEKYTYDNFLRAIETEQGQKIMETLARCGKGLKVRTGTFTQHQDLLTPYVTFYSRAKGDPIAPGDILILCPHLIELNLVNNQIDVAGAQAMAGALEKNTILTKLNLVDNRIGVVGAQAIAGALEKNRALTTLDLTYNHSGVAGAGSMAEALKVNKTLTTLDLSSNHIGVAGAGSMAEALKVNKTLTNLDLSRNQIDAAGAGSMAEALKVNTTLTNLYLGGNQIDAAGAGSMAEALKVNTTLTTLNLGDNEIGVAGAQAIAGALEKNRALTTLNLESNLIASEGAESIAKLLKVNTTLANLNLANNHIISVGAQALWDAIDGNKQLPLETLNLSYNYIPEDIQRKFRALAQERGFKVMF